MERRPFDRSETGVGSDARIAVAAGVPAMAAATEVLVVAAAREARHSSRLALQPVGVDAGAFGQGAQRVGLDQLGTRRQGMTVARGVLRIVDPPRRSVETIARQRIACVQPEPDIHLDLVDEALARAIDDHAVRQGVVGRGRRMCLAQIADRPRPHDERLVHALEQRADLGRHAVPVTGVRVGAGGPPVRPGMVAVHHVAVPLEAAGGDDHAVACGHRFGRRAMLELDPAHSTVASHEALRAQAGADHAPLAHAGEQQTRDQGLAHGAAVGQRAPQQSMTEAPEGLLRVGDEVMVGDLVVGQPIRHQRRPDAMPPGTEGSEAKRPRRHVAPAGTRPRRFHVRIGLAADAEAQRRATLDEREHLGSLLDERLPERLFERGPAVGCDRADIAERVVGTVVQARRAHEVVVRDPDASARHRGRAADQFRLLGQQHARPERARRQRCRQPRRARAEDDQVMVVVGRHRGYATFRICIGTF